MDNLHGYTTQNAQSAVAESPDQQVGPALLRRLRRLLALRFRAAQFLDRRDVQLLDRSIYASYCDCVDLAMGSEARRLLEEIRACAVEGVARSSSQGR